MNCSRLLRPNHDIAREGRSGGLGRLVELLDAGGELEIAFGQAALGVAGQGQGDLVPANVDVGVGMVAGRLGAVATSSTNIIAWAKSARAKVMTIWLPRRSQPAVHLRGNPC